LRWQHSTFESAHARVAFSDDSLDHEFESFAMWAGGRRVSGAEDAFNQLKIQQEIARVAFLTRTPVRGELCTGIR
jgi:hypothetical protein